MDRFASREMHLGRLFRWRRLRVLARGVWVEINVQGEMGGDVAVVIRVVDRDREGDLEPLDDGEKVQVLLVALAASSISRGRWFRRGICRIG